MFSGEHLKATFVDSLSLKVSSFHNGGFKRNIFFIINEKEVKVLYTLT